MQTQNGLKRNSSLSKFVVGAHPIIEHFIETLRIREIIGSYMRTDKRMKMDDSKAVWVLRNPHPGIYIFLLQASGFTASKKLFVR